MLTEQLQIGNHHCCNSVNSFRYTSWLRDRHNTHDGACKYIGENHEKNCNNGNITPRIRKCLSYKLPRQHSLPRDAVSHGTYSDFSASYEIVYVPTYETPSVQHTSLTTTCLDSSKLDAETSYKITKFVRKVLFEIVTYLATISRRICWQHWEWVTARPSGQNLNWSDVSPSSSGIVK